MHVHEYMDTCICMYDACFDVDMYVVACIHVHTHVCSSMYTCIHMRNSICIFTYTYAHMHTHIM